MGKDKQSLNAKGRLLHKGCSVDDLKVKLRSEFKTHLRNARSKSIDTSRNLIQDDVQSSYEKIMQDLQRELENSVDIQPDEAFKILKEAQDDILLEVLNSEAIEFEAFQQEQIESIVENLLSCKICGSVCKNDICVVCSAAHFSD